VTDPRNAARHRRAVVVRAARSPAGTVYACEIRYIVTRDLSDGAQVVVLAVSEVSADGPALA